MWAAEGRLARDVLPLVEDEAEAVFVSAASVWEIEIKRALNRFRGPDDVIGLVRDAGFERLTINFEHAREAGRLPLLHGDPFDRMIVAQARIEGMTVATADAMIARYGVPTVNVARSA